MAFESDPQPFHRFRVTDALVTVPSVAPERTLAITTDRALAVAPAATPGPPLKPLHLPPAAWPPPTDACWELIGVSRDELLGLARQLDGDLSFPGLHDYAAARSAAEVHFPVPRLIAFCMSTRDVKTCLEWAKQKDWLISVRSGSHNGAGFHLCNGITLDLQNLKGIQHHAHRGELTVGPGVRWGEVGAFLDGKGGCLPGGTCGLVAVAGYTQGGGYSVVSRVFGLACDHLISAQVLLADGEQVTASCSDHEDLFWALRGGGGGQFGIVLSLTFNLVERDEFFGFVLNWRLSDAPAALEYMEKYHTSNVVGPDRFGYLVAATTLAKEDDPKSVESEHSLSMLGLFHGTEGEARDHLRGVSSVGPARWRLAKAGRFHELNSGILRVLPFGALRLGQRRKMEITGYTDASSSPDWAQLIDHLRSGPNPGNLIAFEPYGGAIATHAVDATAFPHRQQKLNMKINSYWSPDQDWPYNKDRASAERWLDGAGAIVRPALNGRTYVNYMREDVLDYRTAYWGENFEKLLQVKQKYDPNLVFRFEQSIKPR